MIYVTISGLSVV